MSVTKAHVNSANHGDNRSRRRIVIIQPIIPLYNVALFERLAALPDVDLVVVSDLKAANQLNQYDPQRHFFKAVHVSTRTICGVVIRPGLFRVIQTLKPDMVIVSGSPREWSQVALMIYCRFTKTPVGVWSMFHHIGKRRLAMDLMMRLYAMTGDVLLSYSDRGREEQIKRGASPDKIVVLTTALDERAIVAARNKVLQRDLETFRARMGLGDKRILLHAVRLTYIKRPDVMIRLFAALACQRDDVVLVMLGGGPLEAEIRQLVASVNLADKVLFIGPVYDEAELALWHMASEAFVIATCIGLSAHRAFCYGLPVVTDDNIDTQASEFELLIDGTNSLIFRTGDAEDFVSKINRILNDSALRERLSANAKRRVEIEYTLDQKISRFNHAFCLLGRGHSNRSRRAELPNVKY